MIYRSPEIGKNVSQLVIFDCPKLGDVMNFSDKISKIKSSRRKISNHHLILLALHTITVNGKFIEHLRN
jgi:hypothetical protein